MLIYFALIDYFVYFTNICSSSEIKLIMISDLDNRGNGILSQLKYVINKTRFLNHGVDTNLHNVFKNNLVPKMFIDHQYCRQWSLVMF